MNAANVCVSALLLAETISGPGSGFSAEPPPGGLRAASSPTSAGFKDILKQSDRFESDIRAFFEQHGYAEFKRRVGSYAVDSPILKAEPHRSRDRAAPRRALQEFIAYAAAQKTALASLARQLDEYRDQLARSQSLNNRTQAGQVPTLSPAEPSSRGPLSRSLIEVAATGGRSQETSPARLHHDLVLRLYQSLLRWLTVQHELLIQDSNLALSYGGLLFEQPQAKSWNVADSPGVFSILVRGPDVEVLEEFWRRMWDLDVRGELDPSLARLLRPHQVFLGQVLEPAESAAAKEPVLRALDAGAADLYDALYWNWALYLYEGHPSGKELFGRVCREAWKKSGGQPKELYRRLRETSFPDNTECIWPRVKMSRFDPRILAIADNARAASPLEEMAKVQDQIHEMVRAGKLRGGGIAEYTRGRPHGMNDFLDFGVGGCEAFSSFVTTPLLSLGNDDVHPVFISRPFQPWGHWIAGLRHAGQYYVCDAESVQFGPPKLAAQFLEHVIRTASPKDNQFICLTFYSQTLASWEWEFMVVGRQSLANLKTVKNQAFGALREWSDKP